MTTEQTKSVADKNREHFNNVASGYDKKVLTMRLNEIIGEDILRRREWCGVDWSEDSTRVLDYACGTGMISQIIAPYTKQIIGMDISEKMVEIFNEKVRNQGIHEDEMRAVVADLCGESLAPEFSGPEYHDFDVVVCGFALHHIDNAQLAIGRLVERLRPKTGVLLILDFKPHAPIPSYHSHHLHHRAPHGDGVPHHGNCDIPSDGGHTVAHSGFSQEHIKDWLEGAGLVEVGFVDVGPDESGGKGTTIVGKDPETGEDVKIEREAFMAKGRRG